MFSGLGVPPILSFDFDFLPLGRRRIVSTRFEMRGTHSLFSDCYLCSILKLLYLMNPAIASPGVLSVFLFLRTPEIYKTT